MWFLQHGLLPEYESNLNILLSTQLSPICKARRQYRRTISRNNSDNNSHTAINIDEDNDSDNSSKLFIDMMIESLGDATLSFKEYPPQDINALLSIFRSGNPDLTNKKRCIISFYYHYSQHSSLLSIHCMILNFSPHLHLLFLDRFVEMFRG